MTGMVSPCMIGQAVVYSHKARHHDRHLIQERDWKTTLVGMTVTALLGQVEGTTSKVAIPHVLAAAERDTRPVQILPFGRVVDSRESSG